MFHSPAHFLRQGRRLLRTLLRLAFGALLVGLIILVALRWYFNDERLRTILVEEVNRRVLGEFELKALDLELSHGLYLNGLRLGPASGFHEDVLSIRRISIQWSLSAFLAGRVHIDEVLLVKPVLCMEEREGLGRNIEPNNLLRPMAITTKSTPPVAAEKTKRPVFNVSAIDVPIAVAVLNIGVRAAEFKLVHPALRTSVSPINLKGYLRAEHTLHELDMRVRIGNASIPAHIPLAGLPPEFEAMFASERSAPMLPQTQPLPEQDPTSRDTHIQKHDASATGTVVRKVSRVRSADAPDHNAGTGASQEPDSSRAVVLKVFTDFHVHSEDFSLSLRLDNDMEIKLRTQQSASTPTPLPHTATSPNAEHTPLMSQLRLGLNIDLAAETPVLKLAPLKATLQAGDRTLARVELGFSLEDFIPTIFGSTQDTNAAVAIDKADAHLDLQAMSTHLNALLPAELKGEIDLHTPSRRILLRDLMAAKGLGQSSQAILTALSDSTLLRIVATKVSVGIPDKDLFLDELNWTFTLQVPAHSTGLHWKSDMQLARARTHNAQLQGLQISTEGDLPTTFLLPTSITHSDTEDPARIRLHANVGALHYGPYRLKNLQSSLDIRIEDRTGEQFSAELDHRIAEISVSDTIDAGPLRLARLQNIHHSMQFIRRGRRLSIPTSIFSIATPALHVETTAAFSLTQAAHSKTPGVGLEQLSITLSPTDIMAWRSALPQAVPQNLRIQGQLQGLVHVQALSAPVGLRSISFPPVPVLHARAGAKKWQPMVQTWVEYVDAWNDTLREGLPLEARIETRGDGISFEDNKNSLQSATYSAVLKLGQHAPELDIQVSAARIDRPVQMDNFTSTLHFKLHDRLTSCTASLAVGRMQSMQLNAPLENLKFNMKAEYLFGGDLLLNELHLSLGGPQVQVGVEGVVYKPLRAIIEHAWTTQEFVGLAFNVGWRLSVQQKLFVALMPNTPRFNGGVRTSGKLELKEGLFHLSNTLSFEKLRVSMPGLRLESLSGALPIDVQIGLADRPDLTRIWLPGGGHIGVLTLKDDIRHKRRRSAYYERLLPYRQRRPLTIERLVMAGQTLEHLQFDAYVRDGLLAADRLALNILGADVSGDMVFQLRQDGSRRGVFGGVARIGFSHLDGSYFEALSLEPGPHSELSANGSFSFLFGPSLRDVGLNMTVTKIGDEALDRLLQVVDPAQENKNIQDTRYWLSFIDFHGLDLWMRYESLNMDLDYSTPLRVPGVWTWRPVEVAILRRLSVVDTLDVSVQPAINRYIGPLLGWGKR